MPELSAKILIFDSGVGGLSIAQAVRQRHPCARIHYACDNAAFPYGTKTEDELITRVHRVLHKLQETIKPDIIVVACNTASTVVLPHIRETFSQPIVGVVPAIKPAAQISRSRVIGLLATPGTINRRYTQSLVTQFAADCRIIAVGSSELVTFAETKLRQGDVDTKTLDAILAPLNKNTGLDTLVLACTHFPLLEKELKQKLPHIPHWVDSGDAIARRVGYWLDHLSLHCGASPTAQGNSYFTQDTQDTKQLQQALQQHKLGNIHYIDI
ncbi:MAG: glutamate racemase [Cellvibrionaceae bacterium]|nr:glutamate racemase [Cellvibrionaceae bacterium]